MVDRARSIPVSVRLHRNQQRGIKHILATPEGRVGGNRSRGYGSATLAEMERVSLSASP